MPANNNKGNTNSTIKAEITNPLPFCPLSLHKHYRHITKHYTNLSYTLPQSHYQVLAFLTYIIKPDNSFIYDTHLFNQYRAAKAFAQDHYRPELISDMDGMEGKTNSSSTNKIKPLSAPTFRKVIKSFINSTILIPIHKSLFMLNPCLSYHSSIYKADQYKTFQDKYAKALAAFNIDAGRSLLFTCRGYYLDASVTDSAPLSLTAKKAKSIRAEVSKSTIHKHTISNNYSNKANAISSRTKTPLIEYPHNTIPNTTITYQNMPTHD